MIINVRKLKKSVVFRWLFTLVMVLLSALLQVFVIQAFINPSGLLSSGFTGLAILIQRVGALVGVELNVSLMIILLNVPVALLCARSISLKFTIFSSVQFFCASLFLQVFDFQPVLCPCRTAASDAPSPAAQGPERLPLRGAVSRRLTERCYRTESFPQGPGVCKGR